MRASPAVAMTLRVGTGWRLVHVAVHAAAAGACVAWAIGHLEMGAAGRIAAIVATAAAGAAGWLSSRSPALPLAWDGVRWRLGDGANAQDLDASPQVMIDLGAWMLLRLHTPRKTIWLPASRATAAGAWQPWRAAVYSTAPVVVHRSAEERPPP
jgi:hypothetical protein